VTWPLPRPSSAKRSRTYQRPPQTITLVGYAASHRAVRELKADGSLPVDTKQRSSKYLIEQDHRGVKQRIAVMLGFKQFHHAAITIAGIELMHRIRKGQFGLRRFGIRGQAASAVWNAVLEALRSHDASGTRMLVLPICTGTLDTSNREPVEWCGPSSARPKQRQSSRGTDRFGTSSASSSTPHRGPSRRRASARR
jgi:hypothetical protein